MASIEPILEQVYLSIDRLNRHRVASVENQLTGVAGPHGGTHRRLGEQLQATCFPGHFQGTKSFFGGDDGTTRQFDEAAVDERELNGLAVAIAAQQHDFRVADRGPQLRRARCSWAAR